MILTEKVYLDIIELRVYLKGTGTRRDTLGQVETSTKAFKQLLEVHRSF